MNEFELKYVEHEMQKTLKLKICEMSLNVEAIKKFWEKLKLRYVNQRVHQTQNQIEPSLLWNGMNSEFGF